MQRVADTLMKMDKQLIEEQPSNMVIGEQTEINQTKNTSQIHVSLPERNEKCDPPHGSKMRYCKGHVS